MEDYTCEKEILALLEHLRVKIVEAKPNDRSELDRHYAISITELDKLTAYWEARVVPAGRARVD